MVRLPSMLQWRTVNQTSSNSSSHVGQHQMWRLSRLSWRLWCWLPASATLSFSDCLLQQAATLTFRTGTGCVRSTTASATTRSVLSASFTLWTASSYWSWLERTFTSGTSRGIYRWRGRLRNWTCGVLDTSLLRTVTRKIRCCSWGFRNACHLFPMPSPWATTAWQTYSGRLEPVARGCCRNRHWTLSGRELWIAQLLHFLSLALWRRHAGKLYGTSCDPVVWLVRLCWTECKDWEYLQLSKTLFWWKMCWRWSKRIG